MAFWLERFSMRRWGSLSHVFVVAINFLLFSATSHADTFLHQYTVGKNIGSTVAIDEAGNRYVGSADGNVYTISQSGEEWSFSIGAEVGGTPAVGSESVLFVGSYDGHLYAIDTLSRQKLWSFDTGYPIYSSAAVSLDGTVFIGNRSGDFFAIDGSSGDLKWRVQLGAEIGSSAVTAGVILTH